MKHNISFIFMCNYGKCVLTNIYLEVFSSFFLLSNKSRLWEYSKWNHLENEWPVFFDQNAHISLTNLLNAFFTVIWFIAHILQYWKRQVLGIEHVLRIFAVEYWNNPSIFHRRLWIEKKMFHFLSLEMK